MSAALRAAALHHPPRLSPSRMFHPRMLPPGVRASHRDLAYEGSGGTHLQLGRFGHLLWLAVLVWLCVVPVTGHAQTPTRPPTPPPPAIGSVIVTPVSY